ncbi:MAG: SDR family oxidoreductase [Betaproteobacteria bacterium]|nr:MAG: SDR family oxidoreductase [Betaproteobacteria bacterium]
MAGNVAIVTGSGSGIGAASAVLLARHGWNIVINYASRADSAKEVARACEAHGVQTLLCKANVAEDADCRRMAAEAIGKWGRIDALVNSAGTTRFADHANLEALSGDDFLEVYRINVVGPWQMVRAVAGPMKAAGKGAIVNVSSVAAMRGTGSSVAYAASKAALNAMTLSLARNLGPEIRVNAVCPAMVTGRWHLEHLGAEKYEAQMTGFANSTPLRRRVDPEDVASAIAWLIEGADAMTGQVLVVDAGAMLGAPPRRG